MIEKDLNFEEFTAKLNWKKNKFYENIKRICSKEVYDIDMGLFRIAGETKEEYTKNEVNFLFRKEWVDLAFVLFSMFEENPYYRKNSKATSKSLEEIIAYNNAYLKAIDEMLPIYQRQQIQTHPIYEATFIENRIMSTLIERIKTLLASVTSMPIEARTMIWLEFSDMINHSLINTYLTSMQTKEKIDEDKGEFKELMHGEFTHKSLDLYIAEELKREMNTSAEKARNKLFKTLNQEFEIRDKAEIEASGDSPEFVDKVNENWERIDGEKLKVLVRRKMLKLEVQRRRNKAIEIVDSRVDLMKTIDEYINHYKESDKESDKKIVSHLEEIKNITSQNKTKKDDFDSITEQLLSEINYTILNRQ